MEHQKNESMLGNTEVKTPKISSNVPLSTCNVDSKIFDLKLKITSTQEGGKILGILKPTWMKTLESEIRLA